MLIWGVRGREGWVREEKRRGEEKRGEEEKRRRREKRGWCVNSGTSAGNPNVEAGPPPMKLSDGNYVAQNTCDSL